MRHNSQGRRPGRHRGGNGGSNGGGHRRPGGGGGGGNNRAHVFDSNGPEVRIRGTAYQICEKYQALAKDAAAMGDRVLAESYLQHAEHYQRVINLWNEANPVRHTDTHYTQQQTDEVPADIQPQGNGSDLGLPASIVGAGTTQGALEDA